MKDPATLSPHRTTPADFSARLSHLQHAVEHAAHLLPSQAPIQVFIHHNTLHAFENLPFEEAVQTAGAIFGCQPYLTEERYRDSVARGRIPQADLAEVLLDDLGDEADRLISVLGTRYHLRLAMLQYSLRFGPDAEVRWFLSETDALQRFHREARPGLREYMIDQTRRWVMRDFLGKNGNAPPRLKALTQSLFERVGRADPENWDGDTWETFTLNMLWQLSREGVHGVRRFAANLPHPVRHRDLLMQASGIDIDRDVNPVLIRYCAAFLDQGVAHWTLPARDQGFYCAFTNLYHRSHPVEDWLRPLPAELRRIAKAGLTPLEVIAESLTLLGVAEHEWDEYLSQTLLALRGWAGMIWQMETNAEWTVHPAPRGTLVEYLAVRLILERLALSHGAREVRTVATPLNELRAALRKGLPGAERVSVTQRAFTVFQLAQLLGWKPEHLFELSKEEWSKLVEEIEGFSATERRRIYHQAFERRYRNQTLDALIAHSRLMRPPQSIPNFQVVCCLDEREESFRRHLEEVAPQCETFGVAGFFGVAMYYRGVADAHYVPLCPIVIKPQHYVQEEVADAFEQSARRRSEARRAIGRASHRLHRGSQSIVTGALTALLGTLASVPLVTRVLFPRLTAKVRRMFANFIQPPRTTRLVIERAAEKPGPENGHLGYSLDEMTAIGLRTLQDIGLTHHFARLVVLIGHGSASLNNPHKSAYDCGACGGGCGGPNARALAKILNDPRVRSQLAERGLCVPEGTLFVGALHNTCDDSVTYFDLSDLPTSHTDDFAGASAALDKARRRNAHERSRRFESAELSFSYDAALRHVEGRSEDLSQVRPECGHATNAVCFVGRRSRTKGLFMDRRCFLTSYDPLADTSDYVVLARILQAAIPVCAGINLEYYFSYVDPMGYGCGTKLPHNITSLLGVMDGAASDLRPGLPWQMIEIHEPMRILFIIETTPAAMLKVIERNPLIQQLVANRWVQLATLSPHSANIQVYEGGLFKTYRYQDGAIPQVSSSPEWYRGWRDHLGYASIVPAAATGFQQQAPSK